MHICASVYVAIVCGILFMQLQQVSLAIMDEKRNKQQQQKEFIKHIYVHKSLSVFVEVTSFAGW